MNLTMKIVIAILCATLWSDANADVRQVTLVNGQVIIHYAGVNAPGPHIDVAIYQNGNRVDATITDGDGRFSLRVKPGIYDLVVDGAGIFYTTTLNKVEVKASGINGLIVELHEVQPGKSHVDQVIGPKYIEKPTIDIGFLPDEGLKPRGNISGIIIIKNIGDKPIMLPNAKMASQTLAHDRLGMQVTVAIKGQSATSTKWYACNPQSDCTTIEPLKMMYIRISSLMKTQEGGAAATLGEGIYSGYVYVSLSMPGQEDVRTKGIESGFYIKVGK